MLYNTLFTLFKYLILFTDGLMFSLFLIVLLNFLFKCVSLYYIQLYTQLCGYKMSFVFTLYFKPYQYFTNSCFILYAFIFNLILIVELCLYFYSFKHLFYEYIFNFKKKQNGDL